MINLDFLKIKKNFKKKNFIIDPNFYWKIILFLSFVILILSFGLSFNLFTKSAKEVDFIAQEENKKNEITQKDRIEDVLKYFRERKEKSIEIVDSTMLIIDPSL